MKLLKNYKLIFTGKADLEDVDVLYNIIFILPIMMICLSLYYENPIEIIRGLYKIIMANDVFLTDYIYVSSIGSVLFNSAIITILISLMLKKMDLKPNGLIFSALFISTGFSFIGKNLYNIWPFFIGGFIYTRVERVEYQTVVLTSIFTASLSPIVSVITFLSKNSYSGIILGYIVGIGIGYIMPSISNHTLAAHSGYTLYNTGFAAGFIGAVANSILKSYGYNVTGSGIHSTFKYKSLVILFLLYFLILIYIGFTHNKKTLKNYFDILHYSGRLITDFPRLVGYPRTLINMGVMGLIGMVYITVMDGILCGSTIAGLLTVVGFSSFGKHPKNTIPIMLGVTISSLLLKVEVPLEMIITIGLFATSLAPICGEYGPFIGGLVGVAHLHIALNTASWHAGMNLYNNGFSSGIVAMLAMPIFEALNIPKVHKDIKL